MRVAVHHTPYRLPHVASLHHVSYAVHVTGRHNPEIAAELFPNRSPQWRDEWIEYREGRFRQLAMRELQPVQGLRR